MGSNYAASVGGYSNKANSRFSTIFGVCADSVSVNGEELLDLFTSRRELSAKHEVTGKSVAELAKMHNSLEKTFEANEATLRQLESRLNSYTIMAKEFAAMKAELGQLMSN